MEPADRGFVLFYRKFWDSKFLKTSGQPFTRREAWLYIFSNLANGIDKNGVPRGQFRVSHRYLAKAWLWSVPRVFRFIEELESERMIETIEKGTSHSSGLYKVCNYEAYQQRNAKRNAKRNADLFDSIGTSGDECNAERNAKRNKSKEGLKEYDSSDDKKRHPQNHGAKARFVAFDVFKTEFEEIHKVPYGKGTKADFKSAHDLLASMGLDHSCTPPEWKQTCDNYLNSPNLKYSLADLSQPGRYAIFQKSQLNNYNKPVRHEIDDQAERVRRAFDKQSERSLFKTPK